MLRDAKEAFREGHRANNTAAVVSLRAASTTQGRVDAGGQGIVLDTGGPSPTRPRTSSSNVGGGGKVGGALGLKEFMHRTRVLDLYRGILKVGESTRRRGFSLFCVSPLPLVSGVGWCGV